MRWVCSLDACRVQRIEPIEPMIEPNSRIRFHFRLRLADGRDIESSHDAPPLAATLGQDELIDGLERRLVGLSLGHHRIEVPALEAYGAIDVDGDNVHTLARADFPADFPLKVGEVIGFEVPNGAEIPGTVLEIGETEVRVDFCHPLAGHDLVFDIDILAIEAPA